MVESITSKLSLLPDPYGDRSAKSIDPPPNKPLENSYLYPLSGTNCPKLQTIIRALIKNNDIGADATKPDWKLIKQFLLREG